MKVFLSPTITDDQVGNPLTFEEKVKLFHDRFRGWKFDIAHRMLEGYQAKDGSAIPPIPDAGFAAMDAMFSYFEPIGKYVHGYCDTDPKNPRSSGKYFKLGVRSIFPDLEVHPDQTEVDSLLSMLWEGVRCGLYHAGKMHGNILITGDIPEPIRVDAHAKVMMLNPHVLVLTLIDHLDNYRDILLAQGSVSVLSQRFEARYDFDNA
jgi:hypothetical protein